MKGAPNSNSISGILPGAVCDGNALGSGRVIATGTKPTGDDAGAVGANAS
jgi:hypothetical protein